MAEERVERVRGQFQEAESARLVAQKECNTLREVQQTKQKQKTRCNKHLSDGPCILGLLHLFQENSRTTRQLKAFVRQFQLLFNNPRVKAFFSGAPPVHAHAQPSSVLPDQEASIELDGATVLAANTSAAVRLASVGTGGRGVCNVYMQCVCVFTDGNPPFLFLFVCFCFCFCCDAPPHQSLQNGATPGKVIHKHDLHMSSVANMSSVTLRTSAPSLPAKPGAGGDGSAAGAGHGHGHGHGHGQGHGPPHQRPAGQDASGEASGEGGGRSGDLLPRNWSTLSADGRIVEEMLHALHRAHTVSAERLSDVQSLQRHVEQVGCWSCSSIVIVVCACVCIVSCLVVFRGCEAVALTDNMLVMVCAWAGAKQP